MRWYRRAFASCGFGDAYDGGEQGYYGGQRWIEADFQSPSYAGLDISVGVQPVSDGRSLVLYYATAYVAGRRPGWSYVPSQPSRATIIDAFDGKFGTPAPKGYRVTMHNPRSLAAISDAVDSLGTWYKPFTYAPENPWFGYQILKIYGKSGKSWTVSTWDYAGGILISAKVKGAYRSLMVGCNEDYCSTQLFTDVINLAVRLHCASGRCKLTELPSYFGPSGDEDTGHYH